MREDIFSKNQVKLLPLIKGFSDRFGLVGGTAIALQLGHRRSIDFDLFTLSDFDHDKVRYSIRVEHTIQTILVEDLNELSVIVDHVKLTFLKYPFEIFFTKKLRDLVRMPNLLTLASMKAFALGRRAKWKDYVDLYFIFKKYPVTEVVDNTKQIFGQEFNEKLFREELAFFNDIDRSEKIDYMPGFEIDDSIIENSLRDASLTFGHSNPL